MNLWLFTLGVVLMAATTRSFGGLLLLLMAAIAGYALIA